MCGIGLIHNTEEDHDDKTIFLREQMKLCLTNRGPDQPCRIYATHIPSTKNEIEVLSSVLHIRGASMKEQPVVFENDCIKLVLAWNGEIYNEEEFIKKSSNKNICKISDTEMLMTALKDGLFKNGVDDDVASPAVIVSSVLNRILGEYAFILLACNKRTNRSMIFYGRDPLGRRSLLEIGMSSSKGDTPRNSLILCSVKPIAPDYECHEVLPGKLHGFDLYLGKRTECALISPTCTALDSNDCISTERSLSSIESCAHKLHSLLDESVRKRVTNIQKYSSSPSSVGVLFSGGLDSVVLAALANNHVTSEESIDLINVAFTAENLNGMAMSREQEMQCPDRVAALLSFYELRKLYPTRNWRLIKVDVGYDEVLLKEAHIRSLVSPQDTLMDLNIGSAMWFAARGQGWIDNFPPHDEDMIEQVVNDMKSLDVVRFVGHSSGHNSKNSPISHQEEKCVDESTNSQEELFQLQKRIHCCTKVVLLGIGADEQMAGYGRHRSVYNKGGYSKLQEELQMEKNRIWTRNLGRDCRVISDTGKEARFPFLDEDVVMFLGNLHVQELCNMDLPQGEGDKLILRTVAKRLGLTQCCSLVKRAIQFGSRISKAADKHQFGSSRKASGAAKYKFKT